MINRNFKVIGGLVLALLLWACPSPVINVKTVNAPSVTGITDGYFTTDQTFVVSTGYAGRAEYSLDDGATWQPYSAPVVLSATVSQLYKVVARQYDQEGSVSGNSRTISIYVDTDPPKVFTLDNLQAGVFFKEKTVFVQRTTNAVVDYSTDGGNAWRALGANEYFVSLTNDGEYDLVIRQRDSQGNTISQTQPVSIVIAKNAELRLTPAGGVYTGDTQVTVTPPYLGIEVQFKTKDGIWKYWGAERLSVTSSGTYFGDWSNGTPALLADNGLPVVYRMRDVEGNYTAERSVTYVVNASGTAIALYGNPSGSYNVNQMFSVVGSTAFIQYSTDNGATWQTYTTPFTLTAEGTYRVLAKLYNMFGQELATSDTRVIVIDRTAPAVPTLSVPTGTYSTSQVLTVSNTEVGAEVEYSTDGGSTWIPYVNPVALGPGVYTVVARQRDSAGNTATTTSRSLTITASSGVSLLGISTGWFNANQVFTVSGTPGYSLEYSVDNGTSWSGYVSPVTLSVESTYSVVARERDSGSTVTSTSPVYTVVIDKTPPASLGVNNLDGLVDASTSVVGVTNVEASAVVEYSTNSGVTWQAYTGPIDLYPLGLGPITFSARQRDRAGNYSAVYSKGYYVATDKTGQISVSPATAGGGQRYLNPVVFTISGILPGATLRVSRDNGVTWQAHAGTTYTATSGDYALRFRQELPAYGLDSSTELIDFSVDDWLNNYPLWERSITEAIGYHTSTSPLATDTYQPLGYLSNPVDGHAFPGSYSSPFYRYVLSYNNGLSWVFAQVDDVWMGNYTGSSLHLVSTDVPGLNVVGRQTIPVKFAVYDVVHNVVGSVKATGYIYTDTSHLKVAVSLPGTSPTNAGLDPNSTSNLRHYYINTVTQAPALALTVHKVPSSVIDPGKTFRVHTGLELNQSSLTPKIENVSVYGIDFSNFHGISTTPGVYQPFPYQTSTVEEEALAGSNIMPMGEVVYDVTSGGTASDVYNLESPGYWDTRQFWPGVVLTDGGVADVDGTPWENPASGWYLNKSCAPIAYANIPKRVYNFKVNGTLLTEYYIWNGSAYVPQPFPAVGNSAISQIYVKGITGGNLPSGTAIEYTVDFVFENTVVTRTRSYVLN